MSDKPEASERLSLARWSRRKLEASPASQPAPASSAPAAPSVSSTAPAVADERPTQLTTELPNQLPTELPSIESLTFDSDFTAFFRPEVDESLKRAALKQLFREPRFNVMDGLDVYIDDYTKADPIPPDIAQDLLQRGFSAVAAAPNLPAEEPPASSSPTPAVTAAATEPLAAAATAPAPPEGESPAESTPEDPGSSRSS